MKQAQPGKADKATQDKCYACYLSVVQAIAPGIIPLASAGVTSVFPTMVGNKYQTCLSPPFHPPRATLA